MRFDVVTWVKDGGWCLPHTLDRLDKVLPSECVHRKIAVDDGSCDETVKLLKEFNWDVYPNPHSGISSGANYALSKVDCPCFMSFEQDLLLSPDWLNKIMPLMDGPQVGAASGIRLATNPKVIRDLDSYSYRLFLAEKKCSSLLSNRRISMFISGKTLDNTLYRTDVIRGIGGFPCRQSNSGVDTVLVFMLKSHGFEWKVNPYCVSSHLRKGLKQELNHRRWYASASHETKRLLACQGLDVDNKLGSCLDLKQFMSRFVTSPFVGLFLTYKTGNPELAVLHPLMKLLSVVGCIEGKQFSKKL